MQNTFRQKVQIQYVIFQKYDLYNTCILNKNPYGLWKDIKLNISYFYHYGCSCYTLKFKE